MPKIGICQDREKRGITPGQKGKDDTMKALKRTGAAACAALMMSTLLFSCGKEREFTPDLVSNLDNNTIEVTIGETVTLNTEITAVPAIEADEELNEEQQKEPDALTAEKAKEFQENGTVTYESADPAIVTVDAAGTVTAVSVGETTVTAALTVEPENDEETSSPAELPITVKVNPVMPKEVKADKDKVTLTEGESAAVKAEVTPDNTTDPAVIWKSSNEKVVTVKDGKITAVKAGTAAVTVSAKADEAVKAEIAVTVKEKPAPASTGNTSSGKSYSSSNSGKKSSSGSSKSSGSKKSSGKKNSSNNNSGGNITVIDDGFCAGFINGKEYTNEDEYNAALKEHGLS